MGILITISGKEVNPAYQSIRKKKGHKEALQIIDPKTGEIVGYLNDSTEAEKINPKDTMVLNNIAIIYRYMNNKEKAKIYFEKVIEHGNENEKEHARRMIKDL